MTIETYKKENDLCLLRYDEKYYYLGCIDLPQQNWTLNQYNDWTRKHTVNLIPLTDNFVPQMLSHYGLKIELSLNELCDYYAEKYHCGHDNFNKNGKFKDLLLILIQLEKSQFIHTFRNWVESFYKPKTESNETTI